MKTLETLQKLLDTDVLEILLQLAHNPEFLIMVVAIVPWIVLGRIYMAWLQSKRERHPW